MNQQQKKSSFTISRKDNRQKSTNKFFKDSNKLKSQDLNPKANMYGMSYEYHMPDHHQHQQHHDHHHQNHVSSTGKEIEAEILSSSGAIGTDTSARSLVRTQDSRHRSQGGHNNSNARRSNQVHPHHPALTAEEKAKAAATNGQAGWDVLEITGGVRNMSRSLFAMNHLGALYMANNQISRIPAGIASLKNLTILDLSSNRLRVLPPEVGVLMQLRHLYLQQNLLRTLPFELGRLYKLSTLALDGNPLIQEIFEVYQDYGLDKFLGFLLEQLVIDSPPPPTRNPMPVHQPLSLAHNAKINISVMCYNVLCGQYCSRAQYGYCPQWALEWDYRRKGIMNEIRRIAADIICLQEVETEQYYSFFLPEFQTEDFEGAFLPKSRAKTMHGPERIHVDGCAIFYNSRKYELVEEYSVEFCHLAMSYAHSDGCTTEASENMLNRVMPKDNVGMVALLRVKESALPTDEHGPRFPQQPFVLVVNAHVHWDPEYCDVKLIQCIMLCSRLRQIAEDVSMRFYHLSSPDAQKVPIIFTGDMNSLPDSGVLEFFMKGQIGYLHKDYKGIRYKPCIDRYSAAGKEKDYIISGLQLANAYQNIQLNYTNYTLDFKGVIDYIMYSKNHLNCTHVLRPLCKDWMESNQLVGFPHPHIPSDHIPIYAEFELFAHSILDVERQPASEYASEETWSAEKSGGSLGSRNDSTWNSGI
ncbi:CCR4-NOT transcription complex subunit 6-like [Hypsibius exemplaris]|uniref:poly(A)-specific ribonuclease n=1 Tax=Hypsibius exemplaris TaxID=2072580 RepID=A0A1W0X963_HYPEX|nr:CCR4-NOT transcription complex subunit 6-like [Hypsibius exemplaris]